MPDTAADDLKAIEQFKKAFKGAGSVNKDKVYEESRGFMEAVSELLQKFGEPSNSELVKASSSAAKRDGKFALPTYNVRTPYIELILNGFPIYPYFIPLSGNENPSKDTADYENRQIVQNLSLSFPYSSDEITITGNVKLFVKDPSDILSILNTDFPFVDADARNGLPVVRLRFGWNFAEGNGKTESISIVTKELSFAVMNISMVDSGGGAGFIITLSLQDQGSIVLKNSSGPVNIYSNLPQEQLRILIEGFLKIRLFTLDDLLILGEKKESAKNTTSTFFVSKRNSSFNINNNTIYNAAIELASMIQCRWYPIEVKDVDKEIKDMPNVLKDLEKLQEIRNSADAKANNVEQAINEQAAHLSNRCKLYWVPNFPKEFETSGSVNNKVPQAVGAYLLLPEVTDDPDLIDGSLPIIYGPGASAFPYLYGSAMNVFNTMLEASESGLTSQTFGDVISISASYNDLLTVLKTASANEDVPVKEIGKRSEINAIVKSGGILSLSSEQATDLTNKKKAELAAIRDKFIALGILDPAKIKERDKLNSEVAAQSKEHSLQYTGTLSHRKTLMGDQLDIDGINKSANNFRPVKEAAILALTSRLATFLNYPFAISMTVLGDPNLLPIGLGCFELIAYLPSDIKEGKTTQKLNSFLTGIYIPTTITHNISAGVYTTTIQASKVPGARTKSRDSFTEALLEAAAEAQPTPRTSSDVQGYDIIPGDPKTGKAASLEEQVLNIDLNKFATNPFLFETQSGEAEIRLSGLLTYIETQQKNKKTN